MFFFIRFLCLFLGVMLMFSGFVLLLISYFLRFLLVLMLDDLFFLLNAFNSVLELIIIATLVT